MNLIEITFILPFFFMITYQKAFSRTWVFIYFLGITGKVIINVCVALLFMTYLLN